jgi:RNA polymerase sigma factor (sigma-70 family)
VAARIELYLATKDGRDMRSDPDLAAEAALGKEAAFAELVRRHQGRIRGQARRLTKSASDGDDIAQATFFTAWRRISTYAGGTFGAWLSTICWREYLAWRKASPVTIEFDETAEIIPFSSEGAAPLNDRMDLDRALETLSEAQRICVILCVASGLSHREAADMTGWPLGTVKSHVNRGVEQLRRLLDARAAS